MPPVRRSWLADAADRAFAVQDAADAVPGVRVFSPRAAPCGSLWARLLRRRR